MLIRAEFEKTDELRYISHLELMTFFRRAFRRAKLPLVFSKGFNPHILFSMAQPLKVGMTGWKEYFDLTLSQEMDIGEFIDGLKGTIYYDILTPYKDEEGPKTTFYMEMNLDRLYFNQLKVKCQKLKKVDRKAFENILGENVDLLNIEWIYRGIKFYNLIPEELINYLLPHGLEFNYKELKRMCYSDIETLKAIVLNSKYSFLFDTKKDVELFMERRIERYFYFKFKSLLKKGHLNILTTIAYFHLLEFEIRDIISMLEAKRYGFTLDETVNYLVKKIEGSDY